MKFQNKTIIIISQQDWGTMYISKHHYAVELAKRGNTIYFMTSPERGNALKPGEVKISPTGIEGVSVIKHKFFYPYIIKHKAGWLHVFLLRYHLNKVIKTIGKPVDIIWSFDFSDTISLRSFPDKYFKLFMPVDEPAIPGGIIGAKTANVVFSVTQEIIDKYSAYDMPKLFVNHDVLEKFIADEPFATGNEVIQVGISGNFLRPDVDWDSLLKIIQANPGVIFNFWGAFEHKDANLSNKNAAERSTQKTILQNAANVKVYGVVGADELASGLKRMDAFLICYNIDKDPSAGTNYHKILEYMATGKVTVANNTTTYSKMPDLVTMPAERNNSKLPELFTKVIANLDEYNSINRQQKRIDYARMHTYSGNINRIEEFINKNVVL